LPIDARSIAPPLEKDAAVSAVPAETSGAPGVAANEVVPAPHDDPWSQKISIA
jgi:hypothetical protein